MLKTWCSKPFSYYVLLNVANGCAAKYSVKTMIHLFKICWLKESSKEQVLFEKWIMCNITYICIVTLEQFNASLLEKVLNFLY